MYRLGLGLGPGADVRDNSFRGWEQMPRGRCLGGKMSCTRWIMERSAKHEHATAGWSSFRHSRSLRPTEIFIITDESSPDSR